ncbi:hypothetical protein ACFXKI_00900 [Streptomyces mirabilis]|uniref:hypothetical protein n=1 Tax=Streptomyces mirabilis TaxID=68239 RepID=UPI0036B18251
MIDLVNASPALAICIWSLGAVCFITLCLTVRSIILATIKADDRSELPDCFRAMAETISAIWRARK